MLIDASDCSATRELVPLGAISYVREAARMLGNIAPYSDTVACSFRDLSDRLPRT